MCRCRVSARFAHQCEPKHLIHLIPKIQLKTLIDLIHLVFKVCKPVPKMVPTVSCETRMKEIELKEICIDIDIQLPREECKQEEREDCRSQNRDFVAKEN